MEAAERWFREQPREKVVAIVRRAALRVLPFIEEVFFVGLRDRQTMILMPYLRGVGCSWSLLCHLCHGQEVPHIRTLNPAFGLHNSAAAARHARAYEAERAADAASKAMTVDAAGVSPTIDINSVLRTTDAVFGLHDATASLAADAARPAIELVSAPLWLAARPDEIAAKWAALKSRLLSANEGWEVWVDWYEARLRGAPPDLALERAKLEIPDVVWMQGPKIVNAEIARLIAERRKELEVHAPPNARPSLQLVPEFVAEHLASGPPPEFGGAQELEQRRAIKALTEDLRALIREEASFAERLGMGGNDPPEGERLSEEVAGEAMEALDQIDAELDKREPNLVAVVESASRVEAALRWFGRKLDKFAESYSEELGKQAARITAYAPAGYIVVEKAGALLTSLEQWLRMVLGA